MLDDAQWIINRWDDLLQYRLPGTPRPWRQADPPRPGHRPTDTRAPGPPAPLDLDTRDLIDCILSLLRRLVTETADQTGAAPPPRSHHPHPQLHYLNAQHPHTTERQQERTLQRLRGIRARMTAQFSESLDGQYLRAECPSCHQPGLRVRIIGPEHHPEPVILCEHPGCNPHTALCGKWWHGHPAWPLHEWEWLSANLTA